MIPNCPTAGSRCVKRIRKTPFLILFTRQSSTTGFQFAHLCQVAFQPNESSGQEPPHRLVAIFLTHTVILKGWNLAALAARLANGKIGCLQALPPPSPLPPGTAWIAEIQITQNPDVNRSTRRL